MANTPSPAAADLYGVSAGLDVLSGVFGYLTSLNAASVAKSRADLMTMEAEANAQRYAEQAAQFEAHEKVMYLASGVKLSGSPIDALATTARIASENIASIKRSGEVEALDQEQLGTNAEIQGRNALLSGLNNGLGMGAKAYGAATGTKTDSNSTGLGAIADMLSKGGQP